MTFLRMNSASRSVRIRGARAGDEPEIDNRGSERSATLRVTGVLTANNRLVLPGLTALRPAQGVDRLAPETAPRWRGGNHVTRGRVRL